MSSPVPDAPAPVDLGAAEAGFAPSPPAAVLCAFAIPIPTVFFKFKVPPFGLPNFLAFLPQVAIAFNCDLKNPLKISAPYGGGRVPRLSKSPDDDFNTLQP